MLGEFLHRRVKTLEVAAVLREQPAESWHEFRVRRYRHEVGIVQVRREEPVVAGILVPGRLQGQVLRFYCGKCLGFSLTFLSVRNRTRVERPELLPVFQYQIDETRLA